MLTICSHLLRMRLCHLTVASTTISWGLLCHLWVCAHEAATRVNRWWVVGGHLLWARWRHGRLRTPSYVRILVAWRTTKTTWIRVHGGEACLRGVRRRGIC